MRGALRLRESRRMFTGSPYKLVPVLCQPCPARICKGVHAEQKIKRNSMEWGVRLL